MQYKGIHTLSNHMLVFYKYLLLYIFFLWILKFLSEYVPTVPIPALIVPLPPNVPNNILRNQPYCSFVSFLILLLAPFINERDYLRGLSILIILFISSFEIINVVLPQPNIFLWIASSVADDVAVNPNGIKLF